MEPSIFWFNCAFCGAHPPAVPLSTFLERWRCCPESDFDALLAAHQQVLATVADGHSRWLTKKFKSAAERTLAWHEESIQADRANSSVDEKLVPVVRCPVCLTEAGERPPDRYFTAWDNACKVQTANFLYEAGIIIFALVQQLPKWASPEGLGRIGDLLLLNQRTLASIGLMECPFCGRHTSCLYGDGTAGNPHRCRWCVDACGGMGLVLRLRIENAAMVLEVVGQGLPKKLGDDVVPWCIKPRVKHRRQ